jgi:hypothetical protein
MAKELDPYKVLGVPMTADMDMLDAAFRRRIFKAHPDHGGTDADAAQVLSAAKILRSPARRAKYDRDHLAARPTEIRNGATDRSFHRQAAPATNRPVAGAPHGTVASAGSGLAFDTSSSQSRVVSFMRFSLVGQWTTAFAVFIGLALIVPIFDHAPPGSIADSTVANLTLAWLLVGAVLSRSWTHNPLGQTIRFSWRILVGALDRMDGARR